jgi:hypothetical protein
VSNFGDLKENTLTQNSIEGFISKVKINENDISELRNEIVCEIRTKAVQK